MVDHRKENYSIPVIFRDGIVIILFVVFPFVQVFSSRSAIFFLFLATAIIIFSQFALGSMGALFQQGDRWTNKKWFLYLAVGALLTWSLFSLSWSPLPKSGVATIGIIVLSLMASIILCRELSSQTNDRIKVIFVIGVTTGLVFMGLDLNYFNWAYKVFDSSNQIFDLNRNSATYALLIWPAIAITGFSTLSRWGLSAGLLILTVLVVFSAEGQAAQLALVTSLVIGVLLFLNRLFYWLSFIAMAAGVLLFPLLLPSVSQISEKLPEQFAREGNVSDRLLIWKGYSSLIAERPIRGWGMSAHRYLGQSGMAGKFVQQAGFSGKINHPHNFILAIWVNLGIVGAALLAAILIIIGWLGDGLAQKDQLVMTQIITAWYVISLTGHSLTQSWWIATMAIAAVAFVIQKTSLKINGQVQ